jgi:hypothetical protein
VFEGIWPTNVQPDKRRTQMENLLSKGLRMGVVKIVKRIQLLEKIIA